MALGNDDPALLHAWHPVLAADDLAGDPVAVRVAGEPWVVVRLGAELAAFPDRCPHRRVPLSAGRVLGAELECAYHGWRFDASGACTQVPALGDQAPPLGMRAPVAAGVTEAYGLVWLAPRPPVTGLPELPEHGDQMFGWEWLPPRRTTAGAGTIVDNFLDVAHFSYLHRRTFGIETPVTVEHYEVTRDGWRTRLVHSTVLREADGGVPRTATYDLTAPFALRLSLAFPGLRSAVVLLAVPESATATVVRKAVAWPVADGPEALAAQVKFEADVLEEDLAVLELIEDPALPLDLREEQHTKADRASVGFRRLLADFVAAAL